MVVVVVGVVAALCIWQINGGGGGSSGSVGGGSFFYMADKWFLGLFWVYSQLIIAKTSAASFVSYLHLIMSSYNLYCIFVVLPR